MHLEELPKNMCMPVMNADGTENKADPMKYSTHVIVEYKGHRELIQFLVTETSNSNIVLGYNWLQHHNLNINWLNSTIKLNCCPTQCLLWQKCLGTHLTKNGIRKIQVPDDKLAKIRESM